MTQQERDQEHLKRWIWRNRTGILDAVLLHDCRMHDETCAMIRLAGWDVDDLVLLVLTGGHDGWE